MPTPHTSAHRRTSKSLWRKTKGIHYNTHSPRNAREAQSGDRRDKTEGVENMQVTDVRVRRVEKEGKMKAIVSITLDNEFVIRDIKVIEGEKGLFIAMPSRKAADGEYRDIAHPINSNTRDMIQTIILNKYGENNLAGE